MTTDQIITVATGGLQGGGIVAFIIFYFRGMKAKIGALEQVITTQEQTLRVMEQRVSETEKVGGIYKKLMSDLPKDLEAYEAVISKTKDDVILRLTRLNQEKEVEIEKLRLKEKALGESHSGDLRARQILRVAILLHDREGKDFAKFTESLTTDKEVSFRLIAESSSFSDFLARLGFHAERQDDRDSYLSAFDPKKAPLPGLISMTSGVNGMYAVFRDGKLWMDSVSSGHMNAVFEGIRRNLKTIQ